MPLMIRETYVNETEGHIFGEGEWIEPFTDNRKRLFRECQREYGRCISSMYRDRTGKPPIKVGWVFRSRQEYEDSRPHYDDYGRKKKPETYIRETWVELADFPEPQACDDCGDTRQQLTGGYCPHCHALNN